MASLERTPRAKARPPAGAAAAAMPAKQKYNTPVRRDIPAPAAAVVDEGERDGVSFDDDEDGFVMIGRGPASVVADVVSTGVYTAASAAKGAVAAAAVTAAMNYGTSAAVSYTLETVGVSAIASGVCVSL